jgi:hypothetical protein
VNLIGVARRILNRNYFIIIIFTTSFWRRCRGAVFSLILVYLLF